ncbi:MAG TPA: MATE family efflux transporter [Firmicutes bacterium]|nr:MATE family efflux transporter [Bacillota bacterium]
MSKQVNLLEGSILGKLSVLALPIMMTAFVQMAYNLVDMVWIGQLGSNAVAAVGAAGTYLWIADSCTSVAKTGGQIKVAHSIGEGNPEKAKQFGASAFQMGVSIIMLCILFVLFGHQLMVGVFQFTEEQVHVDAVNYLLITGTIGVLFSTINQIFTGLYTGIGDSKTPFLANAVGLVINLVMDPVLIFGVGFIPAMGVIGAAVATAGAQGVVTLLFLLISYKRGGLFQGMPVFRKPKMDYIKQVWKLGFPVGLQNVFMSGLSLIIASMIAAWGADAIAVQKVGGQVESIAWMIAGGFSMAVNSFIGQNYGAGKMQRVRKGYNAAMTLMVIWGLLCSLVLIVFPEFLFQIFIRETDVLDMGVSYLRILGVCQLCVCMEGCSTGAFNGLGETRIPSAVSIVFNLARIPMAILLPMTPLGLDGIWWALTISAILKGVVLTAWYLLYVHKRKLYEQDREIPAV